jgi:hypothetical protein
MKNLICILDAGTYKPGDPMPELYNQWCEWAEVQRKAGLRQVRCAYCCKYKWPHELAGRIVQTPVFDRRGNRLVLKSRVCLGCEARATAPAKSDEGTG